MPESESVDRPALGSAIGLAALAAVLTALAWPPIGLWPLAFLVPIPLTLLALRGYRKRALIGVVGITQVLLWIWMDRWIGPLSPIGLPLKAMYQSCFTVLFVLLIARVARRAPRLPMIVVAPLLWTGIEFLRGAVLGHGFPWYLIAHPVVEMPILVQTADLFGTYFVGFLVLLPAAAGVDWWRTRARRPVVIAACVWAAAIGYGGWRLTPQPAAPESAPLQLLLVQTSLPQSNKIAWSPDAQAADFARWCDLSYSAVSALRAAGKTVDVVVWPETMLPGFGLEPQATAFLEENGYAPGGHFARSIQAMAELVGVPFLVGSPCRVNLGVEKAGDGRMRFTSDQQFNSAYLVDGAPPYQRADKIFLTPFGETMPYISTWPWLQQQLLAVGASGMSFDLNVGESVRRLEVATSHGTYQVATPICFEAVMPATCRRLVWDDGRKVADVFVNLTNDGWFTAYDGGRLQHAQIARFRCIENRVPMVRVANTGLSMHIDSAGRINQRVGEGRYGESQQEATLLVLPRPDDRRPLFGTVGDLFGWLALAGAAVLAVFARSAPSTL